jgi:hypothetical protein
MGRVERPCKLAIVGSTTFAKKGMDDARLEAMQAIATVIDVVKPDIVISGGARGIDSYAEEIARQRGGLGLIIHTPKVTGWLGYKARNLLIAQDCTRLVRIVASTSTTYGSGWTRDRAKELGKPVLEITINTGDRT